MLQLVQIETDIAFIQNSYTCICYLSIGNLSHGRSVVDLLCLAPLQTTSTGAFPIQIE